MCAQFITDNFLVDGRGNTGWKNLQDLLGSHCEIENEISLWCFFSFLFFLEIFFFFPSSKTPTKNPDFSSIQTVPIDRRKINTYTKTGQAYFFSIVQRSEIQHLLFYLPFFCLLNLFVLTSMYYI